MLVGCLHAELDCSVGIIDLHYHEKCGGKWIFQKAVNALAGREPGRKRVGGETEVCSSLMRHHVAGTGRSYGNKAWRKSQCHIDVCVPWYCS